MKHILSLLILFSQISFAQRISKSDKKIIKSLHSHINYLANDKLEGRRTGTAGEKLAYEYIESQFRNIGLLPPGKDNSYLQEFIVPEGKQVNNETQFYVNDQKLVVEKDFFPLAFSANASVKCEVYQALKEKGEIWFFDLNELILKNAGNPHFDLQESILKKAVDFEKMGASGMVIFNSSSIPDSIKFDDLP
jgi:aminopeptidase YwaD